MLIRNRFRSHPALGVTLWILTSVGLLVSILVALSLSLISVFDTYVALSERTDFNQDFVPIVLVSFVPWVGLGGTGILLALISMRLEPMINNARRAAENIKIFESSKESFHSVQVILLPVDAPIAFAKRIGGEGKIVLSTKTKSLLTEQELEAVLMHELQHLKRNHLYLKLVTSRLNSWFPWFIFASTIHSELHELLELDADTAAARHIEFENLLQARAKFVKCL